jgi:hypothetical protein
MQRRAEQGDDLTCELAARQQMNVHINSIITTPCTARLKGVRKAFGEANNTHEQDRATFDAEDDLISIILAQPPRLLHSLH